MNLYVYLALASCLSTTVPTHLTYGCQKVVNLIFRDWEAEHVTIGLFEVIDIDIVMAPKL